MKALFKHLKSRKGAKPDETPAVESVAVGERLSVIYEPPDPALDIVFVHGFRRTRLWTPAPWLRYVFPRDLEKARILTFGVDCVRLGMSGDQIERISSWLLEDLIRERMDVDRNLIFVAFSLGGILVQQTLLQDSNRHLVNRTLGIMFLGTPHFAHQSEWTKFSSDIMKCFDDQKIEPTAWNFGLLGHIKDEFYSLLGERKEAGNELKVCFFFETRPVYRVGIVVPRASASVGGYDVKPLDANHVDLVSFHDEDDVRYQVVMEKLRQWVDRKSSESQPALHKSAIGLAANTHEHSFRPFVGMYDHSFLGEEGQKGTGKALPESTARISSLASALQYQGMYVAAEEKCREALKEMEQALGKEHPLTLTARSNLALVLESQGKYGAAETVSRQALEETEKELGRDHPLTLMSVSNLARVLQSQGKYQAAEAMNRRALEGRERALGPEHPDTLTSVSNLASVLQSQGYYEAAKVMCLRALKGCEMALGPDHPDTLTSVSNLAEVLHNQGGYEAAEEMNRRALDGREKALGGRHPETLMSVSNLAMVLQSQGKYEAAERMNRRALVGRLESLGPEHPDTFVSMSNLATVLRYQGKYGVAEAMNRRALEGREKSLGLEHPDTLTSLSNLAAVLQSQGKYAVAEEMSQQALKGMQKSLGKLHPRTLACMQNLAVVLQSQGKYHAAEVMNRQALEGREGVLGLEHPDTLASLSNLASIKRNLGQSRQAEELEVELQLMRRRERMLAEGNTNTPNFVKSPIKNTDVNTKGQEFGDELPVAASIDHEPVMKLLLDKGADVNAQGGDYGSALVAAASEGREAVVQLLLDKGADVNAQGGDYGSALGAAASGGHEAVVQLLLDKGADVSAQGRDYGSALVAAASGGHEAVVQLLLDKGADVNATRGENDNALKGTRMSRLPKTYKEVIRQALRGNREALAEQLETQTHISDRVGEDISDAARANFGIHLGAGHENAETMDELQEAIRLEQAAVQATPSDHPNRARSFNELGLRLKARYDRTGAIVDLEEAIRVARAAIEATPDGHPDQAERLSNLASHLGARYKITRAMDDLQEAIRLEQAAIQATPSDHPNRARSLNELGLRLKARYDRTGAIVDLEEAILVARAAIEATPDGHPDRADFLNNLGIHLRARYDRTGMTEDLQDAIQAGRAAIETTPDGHPDRPDFLSNLAIQLRARYDRTGAMEDLQEAIQVGLSAIEAMPENHPNRVAMLSQLGTHLGARYKRTGAMADLQDAIRVGKIIVDAMPRGHPGRVGWLDRLGVQFRARYDRTGAIVDLEEAIRVAQAAVEATPNNHPDRPDFLSNLAIQLRARYDRTGVMEDLQEAIRVGLSAIEATPEDHPDQAERLSNLGSELRARYKRTGAINDLEQSTSAFIKSLDVLGGPPVVRVQAGRAAAENLILMARWQEGAQVLVSALNLLPTVTSPSTPQAQQQHSFGELSGIASLAASVLLEAGEGPLEALQALERGRAIITGLFIHSNDDITNLKACYPALYSRYKELRESIASPLRLDPAEVKRVTLVSAAILQRLRDVKALQDVEREIRQLSDFERFQLAPTETDLMKLAQQGPIVSFNVTHVSSQAFFVTKTGIGALPLPELKLEELEMRIGLILERRKSAWKGSELVAATDMGTESQGAKRDLRDDLQWLWRVAVKPVLQELGTLWQNKPPHELPHVWWIGGGLMALAPLHAAGDHTPGSTDNALSHVVSSYMPTIKALEYSRKKTWKPLDQDGDKVLIVAMPKTPGHQDLQVGREVVAVKRHVDSQTSTLVLEYPSKATVLQELANCTIAHFSCHVRADPEEPSNGAIIVGTSVPEHLTIQDLRKFNHQLAQITYFSAYSEAKKTSQNMVDESIGLASTFQLIGFRHVIGTLWGTSNSAAVEIAAKFYECLLRRDMDADQIVPYALHEACLYARGKTGDSEDLLWWTPFIHVGP